MVNGRDLSRASHDEAVEAFRSAKDPLVVQVLRRTPLPRGQGSCQDLQLVDVCTQTEITFEHIMALAKLRPATPPVPDICPFLLSDSCHSLHTMDQEYLEGSEYMEADVERTDEFEYEEVELCRMSRREKLGLTLCYRTDEEEDIDIYVSEIEPNSIAARDGRIREGDRILQINGRDVQDREEAVAVLTNEESRNIVLLVARPEMQEEPWLDDEHSEFLEELKMEMLEEQRREEEEERNPAEARGASEENITASCSYNQQKISPADGPEKKVLAQIQKRLSRCLREEKELPEGDRYQQLLELKCQIRNSGEFDLFYSRSSTIECSGVQRELRMLNEELRSIEIECQNIMRAHHRKEPGTKLADISEHPEKSDKDSSSAYNTAESSRSTPLAMDRSPDHRIVSLTNHRNLRGSSVSPDHSNPSESPAEDERSLRTRIAALSRASDARHYQSYMELAHGLLGMSDPQVVQPSEPKMEWKVKVRSDGTRYITKRPVRDRLLRERALKIKEERSGGMTTDDDAMSEMKMGRYWSKEERKQHLLRAKEQRRRREFMQRSRLDSPLGAGEVSIIQLSQRKMMKKRNKKILDNWMTIQELMTHGEKAAEGSKVHNAFLSVTTV
ncbi:PDZ domain-containing RING finger protein 4-like isoform X2 [Pimephales promelas]|uniref:PDZ domain-containing RING finger protein 4-like isoform X2 n=1 Tax=Pimephales promelas TaxID=90988 RepID=UPI001955AA63|nr:PDZ domain-containing RING finger protein 4-like isoform X2 [Pimephales promelas]